MGRLFDAVAALLGAPSRCSFEAQAAMQLEFCAADGVAEPYPLPLGAGTPAVADFTPMLGEIRRDLAAGVAHGAIAARFHEALVELGVLIAERAGVRDVALTGGCMQNLRLASSLRARLEQAGFAVHGAGLVPANDGGVSVGQVLAASLASAGFEPEFEALRCEPLSASGRRTNCPARSRRGAVVLARVSVARHPPAAAATAAEAVPVTALARALPVPYAHCNPPMSGTVVPCGAVAALGEFHWSLNPQTHCVPEYSQRAKASVHAPPSCGAVAGQALQSQSPPKHLH
jgi:hypothetical protein